MVWRSGGFCGDAHDAPPTGGLQSAGCSRRREGQVPRGAGRTRRREPFALYAPLSDEPTLNDLHTLR